MSETLTDTTALVTGASSGLGVDFARNLADRGSNLILVARREDKLREVQTEITEKYKVAVHTYALDLATEDAPHRLYELVKQDGLRVDILINNAGIGVHGEFLETKWEQEKRLVELNVLSLLHMTKLFLPDMVERNKGYILQVASTSAYQPVPLMLVYGASKSFVLNFGVGLNYELRKTGVSCTVIAPGFTETDFFTASDQPVNKFKQSLMMKSYDVAWSGIDAMLRRQAVVVPGGMNIVSSLATSLLPRDMAATLAHLVMRE